MLKPRTNADVKKILCEALEHRQLLAANPVSAGFGNKPLTEATKPQVYVENLGNGRKFLRTVNPSPVFQALAAAPVGGPFVPPGTSGQFHINLIFGPNLNDPANIAAKVAFQQAAAYVESQFTDPITVNIDVELGGDFPDPNIIGGSERLSVSLTPSAYGALVTRLGADASSDEAAIISQLPGRENLRVLLPPPGVSGPFSLGGIQVATANLLALGVAPDDPMIVEGRTQSRIDPNQFIDGSITFNLDLPFDYDPSDGISSGTLDFVGTAIHEITHTLGFISAVDDVDQVLAAGPFAPASRRVIAATTLDLFRVRPGDGAADFGNAPRVLAPGLFVGEQVLYTGNSYNPADFFQLRTSVLGEIPVSTGTNFGNGHQASHWFADEDIPGNVGIPTFDGSGNILYFTNSANIGTMDPTGANQELSNSYSTNDLRIMGLIGYDLAPTARGSFTFNAASFANTEGAGNVTVTVTRVGGSTGVARINYTTADFNAATTANAATANVDYTPTSGQLVFLEGETTKDIVIPLLDDGTPENDRVFQLLISPGTTGGAPEVIPNASTGSGSVTIAVQDDDTGFAFSSAAYEGQERAGSATITVVRTGGTSLPATVTFNALPGTATADDFTPITNGVLTFAAGETSKTFTVNLTNDENASEGMETILLSLSDPSGVSQVVSPGSAVLTIRDTSAPSVSRLQLNTTGGKNINSITFVFSEPLSSAPLTSDVILGVRDREGRLGTARVRAVTLRGSSYDPAASTFTVIPSKPLKFNTNYQVTLQPGNVRDATGNALDGNADGTSGDRYVALFTRGNKLSYADEKGQAVALRLNSGLMDAFRRSDGSADTLSLLNTTPGESRLTGTVKPRGSRTEIDAILGQTQGVLILLPQAQFSIGSIT